MNVEPSRHARLHALVMVLVVAAAVAIPAGRLGLLLAIPPGYATAIWPPSGCCASRSPHGWLSGIALRDAGVIAGQYLGRSLDSTSTVATLRVIRVHHEHSGRGSVLSRSCKVSGLPLCGLSMCPRPGARDRCFSAAGRTAQLPGECHCWRHDPGGQRQDPSACIPSVGGRGGWGTPLASLSSRRWC